MTEKRKYNGGVHMERDNGFGVKTKGSRKRRDSPEISQDKWDAIFKKKEPMEPKNGKR